jgi:2-polyprenyl-6-methoxyphenol hydroxylase-like FAD-dependent oxidoreductase
MASMHKLRRVGVYGDLFGPDSPKGSDSVEQGQAISVGLLEDVLRTKAAQLGIRVTYGYQLESVTAPGEGGGQSTVRLKKYVPTRPGPEMDLYNKLKDQPDVLDARSDLVIGATGAGGSTRSKLGLESSQVTGELGEEYIDFTAVGIFKGDGGKTNMPSADKERDNAWVVGLRTPAVDYLLTQITRAQFLQFKDDKGKRDTWVGERGRKLGAYTGELKSSSVFDITLNQARDFVNQESSGVVLGDEAATPHPLTGSGFNTGASSTNLVPSLVRGLGGGKRGEAFTDFSTGVKKRTDLMVGKGTKFFEKNIDKLTKMNQPEYKPYTLEDIGVTPETELEYLEAQQKVMSLYGQGRTSLDISDRLEEYGPDYEDPEQAYRDAQRRVDALFNIPTIRED